MGWEIWFLSTLQQNLLFLFFFSEKPSQRAAWQPWVCDLCDQQKQLCCSKFLKLNHVESQLANKAITGRKLPFQQKGFFAIFKESVGGN